MGHCLLLPLSRYLLPRTCRATTNLFSHLLLLLLLLSCFGEQQYFMRDYRLPFTRYYTRGLMTFIVTHSRSLTLRQGRVYWLPSR